jgi:hypothetical protein
MHNMKQIPTFAQFLNETHNHNLKEVVPGAYVYHSSNPYFRDAIEREGLVPKGKSETWLSDTKIDGKVVFATNSDDKRDWFDSTYDDDVYRITTSGLDNRWYIDPNFEIQNYDKHIITFDSIPRDAIELIHKGTGS